MESSTPIISKKYKTILILSIACAYIGYMIHCEVSGNKLEKEGRYTVAKVVDFKMNFRNGYTVYYTYKVSGKDYKTSMLVSENYNNFINYKFYAKYHPEKPNLSYIIMEKKPTFNYLTAPSEGWKKLPE